MAVLSYECLRCGEKWERPFEQEPLDQCPNQACRSYNYDQPWKEELRCPVCQKRFSRETRAHSETVKPCSSHCRDVQRNINEKKSRYGVYI